MKFPIISTVVLTLCALAIFARSAACGHTMVHLPHWIQALLVSDRKSTRLNSSHAT